VATQSAPPVTTTETATSESSTNEFPASPTTSRTSTSSSPESQQGGAGDETPIATQALFTGRGGRLSPSRIRVPPFIAVSVVLHSADGGSYAIVVDGKTLTVDSGHHGAAVKLPGLRAQSRYVVTNKSGSPSRLTIVASAEPGP
jgi:hypothetical protein